MEGVRERYGERGRGGEGLMGKRKRG